MDLWYLPKDIAAYTGYNYILDIIDHFSKWLYSYTLKSKNGNEILIKLRHYIISFGLCKKLQTDNGLEFKNIEINNYCIDNNIERIYSPPYHPQSNGAIESAHKIIEKFIFESFYVQGEEYFNIEEAILNALKYHNFSVHSTTNYTPADLKDITDKTIIDNVKSNIIKNVASKLKFNNNKLLEKGDKLIISVNISKKNGSNELSKLNNKKLNRFEIPGLFIEYKSGNNILVKCMKNYKNLLKKIKNILLVMI